MIALLDITRTSPLYGYQLHLQERHGSDENNEGLLVDRLVAPRPDGEYISLDLT